MRIEDQHKKKLTAWRRVHAELPCPPDGADMSQQTPRLWCLEGASKVRNRAPPSPSKWSGRVDKATQEVGQGHAHTVYASTDRSSNRVCSGKISQPLTPPPPGPLPTQPCLPSTLYRCAPSLLGDVGSAWATRDAAASQESYTHITGDPPSQDLRFSETVAHSRWPWDPMRSAA